LVHKQLKVRSEFIFHNAPLSLAGLGGRAPPRRRVESEDERNAEKWWNGREVKERRRKEGGNRETERQHPMHLNLKCCIRAHW